MAKAFINERKIQLPKDGKDLVPVHGPLVRAQAALTFSTTTQSAAFGAGTDYIDFTVDAAAHYEIGANPTATTNSARINSGERIQEQVAEGQKIAFIAAA